MIKIIAGPKGFGKTKTLIDMVNSAVQSENGDVICIEKGTQLTFDINHGARLIDINEFDISTYNEFYCFLCGLIACDHDITAIFVNSIAKICPESNEKFEQFLEKLEGFTERENIKVNMTVSKDSKDLSETIKKYM